MSEQQWWRGPVRAQPDFNNLLQILSRQIPDRPTLFELFMNPPLYRKALGPEVAARIEAGPFPEETLRVMGFAALGYDYATANIPGFVFPLRESDQKRTISLNESSLIHDRETFENYPWPDPETMDPRFLDHVADVLPNGMKLLIMGPNGLLENAMLIAGYEDLCYMLADDKQLSQEFFEAIGWRLVRYYEKCLEHDVVGGIIGNDDWGFKTQPLLDPVTMRKYVVPWHRQIVSAAHAAGKVAAMHSCGNLVSVMDDIIDDVQYDGKHSYEDIIMPVEDAYDTYGGRIAILGGIDVDFIIRHSPEEVYKRAMAMLERASETGGYALGTGNSVPEYVPDEQYFAMTRAVLETR